MCCRAENCGGGGGCISLRRLSNRSENQCEGSCCCCAEFAKTIAAVPLGVVLHDNVLYDDVQMPLVESKPAITLNATVATNNKADSITLLCEEVSRLFTQYNAAFKGTMRSGLDAQPKKQLSENVLRLLKVLRCVEATSDNNQVLDADVPAVG